MHHGVNSQLAVLCPRETFLSLLQVGGKEGLAHTPQEVHRTIDMRDRYENFSNNYG